LSKSRRSALEKEKETHTNKHQETMCNVRCLCKNLKEDEGQTGIIGQFNSESTRCKKF
jgi:hypothetical protein